MRSPLAVTIGSSIGLETQVLVEAPIGQVLRVDVDRHFFPAIMECQQKQVADTPDVTLGVHKQRIHMVPSSAQKAMGHVFRIDCNQQIGRRHVRLLDEAADLPKSFI
nr:hypothetical protein [Azospirillum oryzae]